MHISVSYRFNHEETPAAVTGVEGDVTDLLLPSVGDLVRHRDERGDLFEGKVTDRIFEYDIRHGVAVDGAISVTLCLDRTVVH